MNSVNSVNSSNSKITAIYKFPLSTISYTNKTFTLNSVKETYRYPNTLIYKNEDNKDKLYIFTIKGNFMHYKHIFIDSCSGLNEDTYKYYKFEINDKSVLLYEYGLYDFIGFLKSQIYANNALSLNFYSKEDLAEILVNKKMELKIFNFKWIFYAEDYIKFESEKTMLYHNNIYTEVPSLGQILDEDLLKEYQFVCKENYLTFYQKEKRFVFDTSGKNIHSIGQYAIYENNYAIKNPFYVKIWNKHTDYKEIKYKKFFYDVNLYEIDNIVFVCAEDGIFMLIKNFIVHKKTINIIGCCMKLMQYYTYENNEVKGYSLYPLISAGLILTDFELKEDCVQLNGINYGINIYALIENLIMHSTLISDDKNLINKLENYKKELLNKLKELVFFYSTIEKCMKILKKDKFQRLLEGSDTIYAKYIDLCINAKKEEDLFVIENIYNFLSEKSKESIIKKLLERNCFYFLKKLHYKEENENEIDKLFKERIVEFEKFYINNLCFKK